MLSYLIDRAKEDTIIAYVMQEERSLMVSRGIPPRGVAQNLGIRLDAVYNLIWSGKLQATKQDGRWLVSTRSVNERLRARKAKEAAKAKVVNNGC